MVDAISTSTTAVSEIDFSRFAFVLVTAAPKGHQSRLPKLRYRGARRTRALTGGT